MRRAKRLERELEDWVVANLSTVVGEPATFIGRQVPLPVRRYCDVLATVERARPAEYACPLPAESFDLCVIEVKRNEARAQDLVQLLDYMGRLRITAWEYSWSGQAIPQPGVSGVLVAPSFDERVAVAVLGLDIGLFQIDLDGWSGQVWPFIEVDVDTAPVNALLS